MKGTGRPCENDRRYCQYLQPVYFFAQGMCLYIFVGSFSVGLRRAQLRSGLNDLAPRDVACASGITAAGAVARRLKLRQAGDAATNSDFDRSKVG